MATITDKKIIDKIIDRSGYYEGDPRVVKIVEYDSNFNTKCWGVVWENEANKTRYDNETEYIKNPKIIWSVKSKVTYVNPPEQCDICLLTIKDVFYDAKMRDGHWANMCHDCWIHFTYKKLGTGLGQKYKRRKDGKFEKVNG